MSVIANLLRDIKDLLGGSSGGGATADGQDAGNASLASIDTKTPALVSGSVPVYVTNQLDITTISSYLLDIKNSCSDIDANTDAVETKLDSIVSAINANGSVNHADLLAVVAELQAVDANTDNQETLLTSILNKLIAAPSTLAEQQSQTTALNTLNTNLGTDGTSPPVIAGTGVRGWLRGIYESLGGGLARSWTLNKNTDSVIAYNIEKNTYVATYKLTTRPYALSHTFVANTRKQFATIHHLVTATKTVKIRRIELLIKSCSGTATILADVVRVTSAPATGNPPITPSPDVLANPVAEAVCLALPTTAGTEGAAFGSVEFVLGNTGAAPTVNPPAVPSAITLFADTANESQPLTLVAGQLDGIAVVIDSNAAVTITAMVRIIFTEE